MTLLESVARVVEQVSDFILGLDRRTPQENSPQLLLVKEILASIHAHSLCWGEENKPIYLEHV